MDYSGQRPPRAHRPSYSQYSHQPLSPTSPSHVDQSAHSPYGPSSPRDNSHNISFQTTERGDRQAPLDQPGRVRQHSAYQNVLSPTSPDPESGFTMADASVGRKKSLVRPDREKIEPGHRHWHYRTHAARLEDTNTNLVQPSCVYFFLSHPHFNVKYFHFQLLATPPIVLFAAVNLCWVVRKMFMSLVSRCSSVVLCEGNANLQPKWMKH